MSESSSSAPVYCYELKVYHAVNLPKCDVGGKCDLYCILKLPNGTKPFPRTKVYKKDYDPVINETLYETGTDGDVIIELFDKDRYSDDFIGTITVKSTELPLYRCTREVDLDKGMKPQREGPTTLTFSLGRLLSFEDLKRLNPNAIVNSDTTVSPAANELFFPFGDHTFVGFRYEKILSCSEKEYSQPAEAVHFTLCQSTTKSTEETEEISCPSFSFSSKQNVAYSYFVSASPMLSGKAPVLRRIVKTPIYYELRAPNFTFTPLKLLKIHAVLMAPILTKRVNDLFKDFGVADDSYKIRTDAFKDEKEFKFAPKVAKDDDYVVLGASPLFYFRIKRDAASNVELWIDDVSKSKYVFDVCYLAASTDRKVRHRIDNKPFENVNSHHRISFAENVPRLAYNKIEVSACVVKKKHTAQLDSLFKGL